MNSQKPLYYDPDVSKGAERRPIPMSNYFSTEKPSFEYMIQNHLSPASTAYNAIEFNQNMADDVPRYCACVDGICTPETCECERASSVAFDPKSRLVIDPYRSPSYETFYVECGRDCACNAKCGRQMILNNRSMKALKVDFVRGKGYGVFADQPIRIGAPICEYTGIVFLRDLEADQYPDSGYQLDLLHDSKHQVFVVDANERGNVARFMNHSCYPNTSVVCVYPSIPGKNRCYPLPRAIIVACQEIQKNDELSFEYGAAYFVDREITCLCKELFCTVPRKRNINKLPTLRHYIKQLNNAKQRNSPRFFQITARAYEDLKEEEIVLDDDSD